MIYLLSHNILPDCRRYFLNVLFRLEWYELPVHTHLAIQPLPRLCRSALPVHAYARGHYLIMPDRTAICPPTAAIYLLQFRVCKHSDM